MSSNRRRIALVPGAAMALMVVGTAAVAAQGPLDQRANDFGFGDRLRERMHDRVERRVDAIGARFDTLVYSESVRDLGEDGFVTQRIEKGVVDTASATGLTLTLATGDTSTLVADEDTVAVAQSETAAVDDLPFDGPFGRDGFGGRFGMTIEEVDVAAIAPGSEVVVWSTGQEDGSLLARRVMVMPAEDAAADDAATDDAATETDSEASPAPDA